MKKLLQTLLVGAVALVAACGDSGEDKKGGAGSSAAAASDLNTTLSINIDAKPDSLDPTMATDIAGLKVMHAVFEPLVRLDKDCQPVAAAAESWEHSPDYTSWTFHLRKDGKWHNGDTVTSKDFKYAVERLLTPKTGAQYSGIIYPILKDGRKFFEGGGLAKGLNLDAIKTPDDLTITYEMENPTPYFITMMNLFSFLPINKRVIDQYGDKWAISADTYIGNGPFKASEFLGNEYVVTKADTFWNAKEVFWDKIRFLMITNDNTENSAFISGDIDITESVAMPEIGNWRDKPEFQTNPLLATYYVAMNITKPPFDDVRVRKAFSKAIDRKIITERVTQRREPISRGMVPGAMPSITPGKTYGEVAGDMIGPRDVEGAKKLMAEAGYGPGGKKIEGIEYLYNTNDDHKAIGEQLQSMWKEIADVDIRLQNVEWGVYVNRANKGDFMLGRSSWVGDYLDPMTFLEIFVTGHQKNAPQYKNPEYDKLIADARKETDAVKRQQMLIDAEKMIIEKDCIVAPIYSYVSPILVRTDIEGFDRNILGNFIFVYAKRVPAKD